MSKYNRLIQQHNRQQRAYFEATEKRTMLPGNTPYIRRQADELICFGSIAPGERVLEVGCGMGRHTFYLAQQGIKIEGLELSPVLLERLRAFDGGRYNIPLYCADILDYPPELHKQFDAVIGFFVLHHLHNLPNCFSAMTHLVKPGGRLLFVEPNPYNLLYYLQILLTPGMTWQGERGMFQMRRRIIFRAMQEAGLSRPVMSRFGFLPPFLANRAWGIRVESVLEKAVVWRALLPFQLFRGERL